MNKRDRQGVRTPAGLERKYDFGGKFSNQSMTNMTTNEKIRYLDRSMTENQEKNNASMESLKQENDSMKENVDELTGSFEEVIDKINIINQNIGTLSSLYESLNTGKVNKSDVVNSLTITAAGKVADARAVKVLNDKFKITRRVFNVTLPENAYCKPFSYFGSYNIATDIASYGFPIGVYLYTSASVPMPCFFSDGSVRMASGEAANTLVVDYLSGGYQ